jgi:hypothetical protein
MFSVAKIVVIGIIHFAVQPGWAFALDSILIIILDYDCFT